VLTNHHERIDLVAPLSGDFQAVVRLIIGGIAERVDFAFEEIDDLQLAVERLLAEAGQVGNVRLSFEVGESSIRTRVGPLSERAVADALRDGASFRRSSIPSASRRSSPAPSSSGSRSSRACRERSTAPHFCSL
jgi:hypothetical protein